MNKVPREILQGWEVVVIDDDANSLDIAERILLHYGATVHTAVNGKEGLSLIQQVRPRFVVSDISMPVLDGWKLIEELKRDPRLANIPVIALTAHAMIGDRERAIAAGFHNYLSKPLSPGTFITDLLHLLVDVPALNLSL